MSSLELTWLTGPLRIISRVSLSLSPPPPHQVKVRRVINSESDLHLGLKVQRKMNYPLFGSVVVLVFSPCQVRGSHQVHSVVDLNRLYNTAIRRLKS